MELDACFVRTLFLTLYVFIDVISAGDTCSGLPPTPSEDVTYVGSSELVNGEYQLGARAVYKCGDDSFGYVSLACLGNDRWGSQSRACDDDLEFGMGSIVGVSVFGLAVLIVVLSLIGSSFVVTEKPATAV